MLKIGITGGIGSGKTTVCRIFELLGVPVFYADSESKVILDEDAAVKEKLIESFGNDILLDNGNVDRKHLSDIVFSDRSKLEILNSIVHPAVFNRFKAWCETHSSQPYVIKEAAILFESGADKELDRVISVFAPREIRIRRVIERDKILWEDVLARMKQQITDEERIKRSSFVIYNDEEHPVIPQILNLHTRFTALN